LKETGAQHQSGERLLAHVLPLSSFPHHESH